VRWNLWKSHATKVDLMPDIRESIHIAVASIARGPFRETASHLLSVLGYQSDRTVHLGSSDPQVFIDFVQSNAPANAFNKTKALCAEWSSADLLFQLTDNELAGQKSLFDETAVTPSLLQSYLFFAIELTGDSYARGRLTDIARQINRVFPMPVMVLLKHKLNKAPVLSIAVINRRQHKRDASKDVLGKVTIIRDISIAEPHRGHLDILASFAFDNLVHPERLPIDSFDALHAAWESIFNVELLNKRFYRELANWYFWALPQVEFPTDAEPDDEKRRATSLIRLLTRLIFCWFLKEKDLISERLFNESELRGILKELNADSCSYHQAILQNLFFATLNQRMGKDDKGRPYRQFAKNEKEEGSHSDFADNMFRYEEHFRDPIAALDHFGDIPFLNGGLFECLDRVDPKTKKKVYIDGFSRDRENRPYVPNELFFGEVRAVDLSDSYGERTRRNERVRGLLRILNSYKFTIIENTPIDQEIALDPELLGKVFENLLASYNEETKTTARKQTGSFYTPRPIVEYMVDQSLMTHLAVALTCSGMSEQEARGALEVLFAWSEQPHPFSSRQVDVLLEAIHTCKILDPACGSGAFPMGTLHKLVYIIHKLDPSNSKWKQLQIDKASEIPDASARDAAIRAIEQDFRDNEDDYGRKLYLIENCLYGVDVQPIAIQISKLRFFISLVCDQKTNRRKRQNHGIRPLPNLETKFVSANTLISLKKDAQRELFENTTVKRLEAKLQQVRHDYFAVSTRQKKLSLQKRDHEIRDSLAGELEQTAFYDQTAARKLVSWDPYDPQSSADYFEPLWMFDASLIDGFDIVIGNPPYYKENDDKERFNGLRDLECYQGKMDVWYLFADVGLNFLKENGVLSYIATNNWVTNAGASKIRNKIIRQSQLLQLIDFRDYMIFESSSIQTMVMLLKKCVTPLYYPASISRANAGFSNEDVVDLKTSVAGHSPRMETFEVTIEREKYLNKPLLFKPAKVVSILNRISASADSYLLKQEIAQGIVPNPDRINSRNIKTFPKGVAEERGIEVGDGVFVLTAEEANFIPPSERKYVKALYEPVYIDKYLRRTSDLHILYTKRGYFVPEEAPAILRHLRKYREVMEARRENRNGRIEYFNLHWPRDEAVFLPGEKLLVPRKCAEPTFFYTRDEAYVMLAINVIQTSRFDMRYLSAVLNSSVIYFWLRHEGSMQGLNFQLDASPLQRIPLPKVSKTVQSSIGTILDIIQFAHGASKTSLQPAIAFFEDVADACVMECYFSEHMAKRDLMFLSDLAPQLTEFNAEACEEMQCEFVEDLYRILNASNSSIRNRLLRLCADSPNLLAKIKNKGQV